jgi:hypothetical protein
LFRHTIEQSCAEPAVSLLPGSLEPTPLDRGIGPPFTDSARPAGDRFLEAPGVLFELLFVLEDLAQKAKQDLPVGFFSIRNPVKDTIAVASIDDHSRVFQVGIARSTMRSCRTFADQLWIRLHPQKALIPSQASHTC